jgi:RNase P protein component
MNDRFTGFEIRENCVFQRVLQEIRRDITPKVWLFLETANPRWRIRLSITTQLQRVCRNTLFLVRCYSGNR